MNDLIVSFRDDMLESGCQIDDDNLKKLLLNFKLNNLTCKDVVIIDKLLSKIRNHFIIIPNDSIILNPINEKNLKNEKNDKNDKNEKSLKSKKRLFTIF